MKNNFEVANRCANTVAIMSNMIAIFIVNVTGAKVKCENIIIKILSNNAMENVKSSSKCIL